MPAGRPQSPPPVKRVARDAGLKPALLSRASNAIPVYTVVSGIFRRNRAMSAKIHGRKITDRRRTALWFS